MIRGAKAKASKSININCSAEAVLPAAGVLVELSACKALVAVSGSQNLPSFLSTADVDPGEVW